MERALLSPTLAVPVLAVLLMWMFCLAEEVKTQWMGCSGLGNTNTSKEPPSSFLFPVSSFPLALDSRASCLLYKGDVGWVGGGFSCHTKLSPFPLPSISKVLLVRAPNTSYPFSFPSQLHLQAEQIIQLITPPELLSLMPSESSTRLWHSLQPENSNLGCFCGAPSGWPRFSTAHRGNNFSPSGHYTFTCSVRAMTTS